MYLKRSTAHPFSLRKIFSFFQDPCWRDRGVDAHLDVDRRWSKQVSIRLQFLFILAAGIEYLFRWTCARGRRLKKPERASFTAWEQRIRDVSDVTRGRFQCRITKNGDFRGSTRNRSRYLSPLHFFLEGLVWLKAKQECRKELPTN